MQYYHTHQVRNGVFFFVLLTSLFLLIPTQATAAKKKKKSSPKAPAVELGDYHTVEVQLQQKKGKGKKKKSVTRSFTVACYNDSGGQIKSNKGIARFFSYRTLIKNARKKITQAKKQRKGSLQKKWVNKKKLYLRINKAALSACQEQSDTPPGIQPAPDLSLQPYTGTFGAEQARILFDRFCFGGSQAEIDQAVAEGLDATVARLTTWINEPHIDSAMSDIQCDRYLKSEESDNEEECNPRDPNDFRVDGFRQAMYHRMVNSQNCFHNKLFTFLHDERLAVSTDGLPSDRRHLMIEHYTILDRASRTGDYLRYIQDSNLDGLVAYFNLDLGSNSKFNPNENYAREFWEILTIGPTDENTAPLYSILDIAQSSLAFTGGGWQEIEVDIGDGETSRVDLPSYSTFSHATGPKTIFAGTPYEAIVDDQADVVAATAQHPYLARHLAKELLEEYLVPNPSRQTISKLADVLRSNNYNVITALQVLMRSEDLYSTTTRKALLKHSWDFLFGFLRTSKYPINHREMDWYFDDLGQQLFISPSIFGWDTDKLNAERYVLERRNIVIHMMNFGESTFEERGYSLYDTFVANLPSGQLPDEALIDRISNLLNVRINSNQHQLIKDYLNYSYYACDSSSEEEEYGCRRCSYSVSSSDPTYCDEAAEHYVVRNAIDLHPEGGFETKLQGLLAMFLTSPEYLTK